MSDTVKVDSSRFDQDHHLQFSKDDDASRENVDNASSTNVCKENTRPPPLEVAAFQAALKERQEQEEQRQKALEEARVHRDEVRRLREERLRLEAERREVEALAEERRQREFRIAEAEAEEARSRAEENLERARAAEQRKEVEAQEAAEQIEKERLISAKALEDKKALDDFLASRGYSGVNSKRTKMLKSKYPLHTAVKDNSLKLVELLLCARADPAMKSSAGLTPAHLAMKIAANGSHDDVIRTLQKIRN